MNAPFRLFECAKAPTPIRVGSALVHEALVGLALDPEVDLIESIPRARALGCEVRLLLRLA